MDPNKKSWESELFRSEENEASLNDDASSTDTNDSTDRQVLVHLSECFVKGHDKRYLFDLFVKRDKTGGGYITNFEYFPERLTALITYKSNKTAMRVLSRREIKHDGYNFLIRRVDEATGAVSKSSSTNFGQFMKQSELGDDEKSFHKAVDTTKAMSSSLINKSSISDENNEIFYKNKFYLQVESLKSKSDELKMEKNATILAKTKPEKVTLIDSSSGKWLIELSDDKKIGNLLNTFF